MECRCIKDGRGAGGQYRFQKSLRGRTGDGGEVARNPGTGNYWRGISAGQVLEYPTIERLSVYIHIDSGKESASLESAGGNIEKVLTVLH